jgi:hypothetical protein
LPFAIYRRDVSAKRPFNIANIKNTTSTIGNFAKENEFVFTNSRTANNRAFVKAEGFSTGSTLSGYINNFYDYAKPNRDILSGSIYGDKQSGYSSHVIVNRFSAPGGPETAGDNQGGPGLDYQAAEFSPYNNINFRNLTVRNPLRTFLTSRMEQFGIASGSTLSALDYNNTASFHKQHRNGRSVVTQNSSNDFSVANSSSLKTRYDNAYVETPVPGDEIQYSWITASATTSTIVGYQDADGYDYTNGVLTEQLNFVSSSDVVSYKIGSSYYFSTTLQAAKLAGVEYLQNNTVGLNTIITDPLFIGGTTSQGYPLTKNVSQYVKSFYNITNFGRASILNTILLNRNDQYGYNTFKQVRTGERKIARKLRELNFLTFNLDRGIERVITTSSGSSVFSNTYITKYSDLYQYKEPVATTRFRPVSIVLATNKKGTIKRFEIQTNHGNNLIKFANEEANTLLNLDTKVKTPLNSVINFYKTSDKVGALELNYSEIIYPKETNLYLGRTRARQSYENNFWRDSEDDRQVKGRKYKNTSATRPAYNFRRSSWDLDEFPEFDQLNFDNYPNPNPLPLSEWFYKRPGILQNFTTFNKWYSFKIGPTTYDGYINPANLNVQPTFARTHMEYNYGSLVNKFGMDIYDPNDINLRTDLPYSSYAKASLIGSGYAKWEAPEQANKLKEIQVSGNIVAVYETTASKPFYDSYEEYAEDIRSIGKEMSIIPEFRISEHIKKISSGEVNEFTISDFLKVPNSQDSSIPNDSSKDNFFEVYSNSDFLKYFEVVRDSNKGFLYPDRLTLKCKAVKKFLPYNGFYPAERTTEIAQKFFECYGDSITTDTTTDEVSDTNKLRPTLQTMFAPGIMYNTIKSGLAVDYPIYTGSYQTGSRYTGNGSSFAYEGLITDFHKRVPFEAIYDPATHLNNLVIYDNEPMVESRIGNSTGTKTRLNNVISIGQANRDYIYAINNFLAESANLFLEDSEPTKIVSAPEDQFLSVVPGRVYGMRIKMWRSMSRSKPLSGSWGNYPVPQDMPYSAGQSFYILVNKHFLNGGSKQVLSKNTDCENFETVEVARNSTLSNLTCSITISGALNSYTFVGTGSNYGSSFGFGHYTSTTFDIDTDSSANTTDNLDNTMNALVAAINSGASTEFKASYEGQVSRTGFGAASADYFVLINNEDYCDNVTFEASTFGVVRVDVKTPYITATMAVSNSVQPSTDTYKHWIEYAGGTVGIYDQYFIITNDLEDFVNYSSTTSPIKDEILFVNSRTGSYPDSGTLSQIYHKELFTMYSRPTAFGPPMLGVTGSLTSVSLFQSAQDVGNGYNYGFTPPYYYGESWVDVLYIPQDDAQMNSINTDTNVSGSISEINKLRRPFKPFVDNKEENEKSIFRFIAPTNATIGNSNAGTFYNCIRYDYSAGDNPGTDLMAKDEKINSNAMQLSASLNMFESIVDENGKTRWVIKTKYETPHFNFNHLETPEDVFYPTGLPSASVPRGIWHQFGRIPTQEGVYMSVEAIPQNWLANSPIANYSFLNGQGYVRAETYAGIYNLAEVCGFSSTPVKVGRISPKKKVKEAIVAIPFLEVEGERQFLSIDRSRTSYIKQAINYVETLKGKIESIEDFITKAEQVKLTDIPTGNAKNIDTALESTSITEMLIKAKSYVLPPVFDYMNFNVDPINMYIFEFEHEFDKNDLSYIWQNVMPKNDQEFEVVESIVSHPLLSDELLGDYTKQIGKDTPVPTEMPENLKWLVFKIKQRANKDYKKFINKGNILNSKEEKLSYNWPYDYFSLVELAKLESEVTLTPERTKAVPENGIQLTDKGFMNLGKRGSNVIISSNLSTSDLNDSTIESINKTISNKISTVQLTDITAKETPTTIEDKQVSGIVTNAVQVKGGLASSTQIGLPNRGLVQDPRGGEAGQSFSNELTRLK